MGKADITRGYIIRESAPLFNRKGYVGTSLSDITEALGLTKGAVYGNFANKDEIAVEALAFNFNEIREGISAVVEPVVNSCDKLIAFARFYADNYRRIAEGGGCPILNASTDSDDGNPKLRKKVNELLTVWRDTVVRIIARGKKRGEISDGVDSEDFASFFIVQIEGGIMLSKITGRREHLNRAVERIVEKVNSMMRK